MLGLFIFAINTPTLTQNNNIQNGGYIMVFGTNFKIVVHHQSGVTNSYDLRGKRKDVRKEIELFKKNSICNMMVGRKEMVVWA